jgi:N-acetylglutamate synthase-like GNAT family acetyltransferase
MNVRLLREGDYEEMISWWRFFRFPAPAKEFLPENGKGGLMVEKEGVSICAGFIYFTNSKIAWLEFIVSNPEYRNKDRKEAIQIVITELCQIAKQKGFRAVFTSVKHQGLVNHFEKCGFNNDAHKSNEMTIIL